jgi:hypothetical protein
MAAITESKLVARVRQRADMESNDFVSDLEVQTYINAGLAELHDILIQTYGQDYYVSNATFNTVAGTDTYPINSSTSGPNISNFYKLRGMDAKVNGADYFTLRPFNFNERNVYQNWGSWSLLGLTNIRYRMVGDNIVFTPQPDNVTEVKVWFIPTAQQFDSTAPATSTTTFADINGYAEYVVIDAAIKCLQKEESDVQVLMAQKTAMKRRIEEAANNRDAGSPLQVSDIYGENNYQWFTRSTS